jgi:putative lipoic acid-binding regulatory protein
MAEQLNSQLNIQGTIEGLKNSVKDYAIRIIKQQAPDLTDRQIEELTRAWIPEPAGGRSQSRSSAAGQGSALPVNVLASMVDQFVSFSLGRMEDEEDKALRREMGPWPDKYWKSFPQVVRLLIKDFLNGVIEEGEFNTRIGLALQMR